METVLVARFSHNIEADLERGWSAWQGLSGTYDECVGYYRDLLTSSDDYDEETGEVDLSKMDIREFPELPGVFGCVHHNGLSCYLLQNSITVEDAIEEVKQNRGYMWGGGWGDRTIGKVKLLKSIRLEGTDMDLHILEADDIRPE